MSLRLLAAGAAFAILAPLTAQAGVRAQGSAGSAPAPVAWAACGPRLECAGVPVPLDWDRPRGRTITLTTPPRGTVCPSDRRPFDPEFGQPVPRAVSAPGPLASPRVNPDRRRGAGAWRRRSRRGSAASSRG